MKIKKYNILLILILLIAISGCKKYLDAKSNQSLVVISNLQDLQALLDNNQKINVLTASADEISSDEYYLPYANFQALGFEQFRNMYTWQPANLFVPRSSAFTSDWAQLYDMTYVANTVLDNMGNVDRTATNAAIWDNIKGQAMFIRGYAFLKAASIWSLAYDNATANTDLGIPLRLTSNFNVTSARSTVAQTYDQVIADTKNAIALLSNTAIHPYRSSKPAAYALMAKTYLAMRQYGQAGLYADSCLQLYHTLTDFNSYDPAAAYPITQFNKEVIFDTSAGGLGSSPVDPYYARVDNNLYQLYDVNDLRKTLFFATNADGTISFRGTYEGAGYSLFNGIASDEVYIIRAECYSRAGNASAAMDDLNTVLSNRYKTGTFVALTASNSADALAKILLERQKELIMRGTRWMDIKRLNKEGAGISLKRNLNGQIFTLPANDLRFALPLPDDIISLSGMQQNPR